MCFLQQDYGRMLLNYLLKCQSKRQSVSEFPSDETLNAETPDSVTPDILKSGAMTPDAFTLDIADPKTVHNGASDQQLTSKLRELANKVNGTQLPLTRNGLDGVEDPVDERNEKREKGKKEDRDKERRDALRDVEVDIDQEDSEIKENKYQKTGKGLPDEEDSGIENKKLRNSENLITYMIENLQGTVEKQSAVEMERTARMPQNESFDFKFEKKLEPKDHRKRELNSTNNTDSEGLIKTTEDKANYMKERIHVDLFAEQGKKDRSENRQSVKNEADIETEAQSLLEIDKQRETPVDSYKESETFESQECSKEKKDTEYSDENEKDIVDSIESGKRMNKEKERQGNPYFGEKGNSYYKKIENVVKGLNIMEEETEAHINNTRYSISDFPADSSKQREEIMSKQNKQNQMTQDNEMEFQNEKMNRDEQTQESDMDNESRDNLVEKIEDHSFVVEAQHCNDHTLKDVLNCDTSGQEEFLSPEEVYKVRFVFDVLYWLACVQFIN